MKKWQISQENCVLAYIPKSFSEKERSENINPPRDDGPEDISRINISMSPIVPWDIYVSAIFSGRRRENILDPSSGGMGMRLKIANNKFNWTTRPIMPEGNILKIRLKITAIATLVSGPAKETKAKSFLPSRKLKGSTGTGLAPPIIIGEPEIRRRRGKAILIIGSICFLGSRVSRPIRRAVGSPKRSAT